MIGKEENLKQMISTETEKGKKKIIEQETEERLTYKQKRRKSKLEAMKRITNKKVNKICKIELNKLK